jgi:group I intron endonuclease
MEHLRSGQPEKYSIKSERDKNVPIHQAMQKYGIDNFEARVLEECERSKLDEKEKYWISHFNSNNKEIGYNLTEGG